VTSPAGILAQWTGILTGPIVFAADEFISYSIVQWSCGHQNTALLHLITVVALVLIAGGAWSAWRTFIETPSDLPYDPDVEVRDVIGVRLARARFLAVLGLLMSAFFAALVIAAAIPRLVLNAC